MNELLQFNAADDADLHDVSTDGVADSTARVCVTERPPEVVDFINSSPEVRQARSDNERTVELGCLVKQIRMQAGLSRKEVAERSGIPLANIGRIEVDVEEMPGQAGGYARTFED